MTPANHGAESLQGPGGGTEYISTVSVNKWAQTAFY